MSLKAYWQSISAIGLSHIDDPLERHSVALTNRISIIALPVILFLALILGLSQWNREPLFVLATSVFFLLIPILNRMGYSETARLVLCFLLPLIIMGMSVISKTIPNEDITNTEYFDYRYVLIASSVVPPIVFNFRRRLLLFFGVTPFFFSLIFFDQIHQIFGVGFYQIVHDIDSYPTTTWVSSLMFLVLAVVLFMLRWSSDSLQLQNAELIKSLQSAQDQLKEQNEEIKDAHAQIKTKNELLNDKNELLAERVQLANKELQESNDELVKHNNELKQFSHAVSHNLRAPVAKILAVSEFVRIAPEEEKEEYLSHLFKSAKLLDAIIRDLNTILDIRRDIFRVRRKVQFKELFEDIFYNYETEIKHNNVSIETDFQVESIYTIKPYMVSILDNLFSNALKYYAEKRSPLIKIGTSREGPNTVITIWDNGIGIDLKAHEKKLFRLYKRLNTKAEGKGIGLYLAMKQIESLEGSISINSELDVFTEFTIRLPDSLNVNHQPLLEEDFISVAYNALTNAIIMDWKQSVETEELSNSLDRILVSLKTLELTSLIVDVRKRGGFDDPDGQWMLGEFFPKLFKMGINKLSVISDVDGAGKSPLGAYADEYGQYGIELTYMNDPEEHDLLV